MDGFQATTAPSAASRSLASAVFLGTDANGVSFVCNAGGLGDARQQAGSPVEVSTFLNPEQNNSADSRLLSPADLQGIYEAVARAGSSSPLAAEVSSADCGGLETSRELTPSPVGLQAMQLVQHVIAVEDARGLDSMRYSASVSLPCLSAAARHELTLRSSSTTRRWHSRRCSRMLPACQTCMRPARSFSASAGRSRRTSSILKPKYSRRSSSLEGGLRSTRWSCQRLGRGPTTECTRTTVRSRRPRSIPTFDSSSQMFDIFSARSVIVL